MSDDRITTGSSARGEGREGREQRWTIQKVAAAPQTPISSDFLYIRGDYTDPIEVVPAADLEAAEAEHDRLKARLATESETAAAMRGEWQAALRRAVEAERERDEARVRLAEFMQIANETIDGGHDAAWFRALLHKRLGDLGPEYEIASYLKALREHDGLQSECAGLRAENERLREALEATAELITEWAISRRFNHPHMPDPPELIDARAALAAGQGDSG